MQKIKRMQKINTKKIINLIQSLVIANVLSTR